MTDIPTHDQFSLPGEVADSASPSLQGRGSRGGGGQAETPAGNFPNPPAPSAEGEGEIGGAPSEDWRARGLAHPAGRGWQGEDSPPRRGGAGGGGCQGGYGALAIEPGIPLPNPSPNGEGLSDPMGTAEWTVLTPERLAQFLAQLAECGNVRLACRAAGISPQTAYRARRKSAALARQWDAARLAARPIAEEALADKAMHGWMEAQFYRGEPCGEKYRFDGRLLLAHLGRLDKLAERLAAERRFGGNLAEEAALAGLDAAIATLEGGDALAEPEPMPAPAGRRAHDSVPGVPSSPQPVDWGPEWCTRWGDHTLAGDGRCSVAECRDYTARVERMEAARPAGVPDADELAEEVGTQDDLEGLQLLAFEARVADWWTLESEEAFDAAMADDGGEDEEGEEKGEGEAADGEEEKEGEAGEAAGEAAGEVAGGQLGVGTQPSPGPGCEPESEPEPDRPCHPAPQRRPSVRLL